MATPRRRKKSSDNNSGLLMGILIGGGAVGFLAVLMLLRGNNPQPVVVVPPPTAVPAAPSPTSPTTPSVAASVTPTAAVPVATQNAQTAATDASVAGLMATTSATMTAAPANGIQNVAATTAPAAPANKILPLPELIKVVEPAVVRISVKTKRGNSLGSGFLADKSGIVVTNYHVIAGTMTAEAEFHDGRKFPVEGFYHLDANRDIAIIKIAAQPDLTPLPLASQLPDKGISVAAFGAPQGFSFTATEGVVSAVRTAKEARHDEQANGTIVQTTAPISPGNSGGPLVNMSGEVIAINTFQFRTGQNLNFGISCIDISETLRIRSKDLAVLNEKAAPDLKDDGIGKTANLVGTDRGRVLLSQIREAVLLSLPLSQDPTGRIMDFVERTADRTIESRLKWKTITRSRDFSGSTALIVMVAYFAEGENNSPRSNAVDLVIHTQIICRDVDKDGVEVAAKVYDKEEVVGKASPLTLAQGVVSRSMESGIKEYFSKLISEYKAAVRSVETPPDVKADPKTSADKK